MLVSREDLLAQLESVQPGLSPKEIVEQSSCFGFVDGQVLTYNDDIACRRKCVLNIEGAVTAAPFLALLQKLPNKEYDITVSDGELLVNGKRARSGVRMEKEVLSPVKDMKMPTEWSKLPDNFGEAVDIAAKVAGTDAEKFSTTCVNIAPKWIEATDNYQIARYKIDTGFPESIRVKHTSIQHIVQLGMSKFAFTKGWVHFKNTEGLMLSCRRYMDNFPNLTPWLDVSGVPTNLPGKLAETIERAEIFATDDAQNRYVRVELREGRMKIRGEGEIGWYEEMCKASYEGEPISFHINPKLLGQITEHQNEIIVSMKQMRIRVSTDRYTYISVLGKAKENGKVSRKKAKSKAQDSEGR